MGTALAVYIILRLKFLSNLYLREMEDVDSRFEILFKLMPLLDGSNHSVVQVLQQCLALPYSRDVLLNFNVHQLLAVKCTTRVAISGIAKYMSQKIEERREEKEE